MTTRYKISKMTCGGCLANVTSALQTVTENVTVTLNPSEAIITSEQKIPIAVLQEALSLKGAYQIEEIEVLSK
ncbi:cation transporter [Flavobacterium sp. xlx-214]|uniref:heavy-metal-associated domain-containing protein n=1 Tax=unclassified Flavobacterium TaxID=196869 RepID=UPI0013D4EC49|nr:MULTISPECIES: cation transporter [unclassified Flavobacterium]MBA5793957.1 cation transporter [Flavobacterium sp. xlx-221]QMI82672.1 cation transporter [Flavobacterium sp. xlx-214]